MKYLFYCEGRRRISSAFSFDWTIERQQIITSKYKQTVSQWEPFDCVWNGQLNRLTRNKNECHTLELWCCCYCIAGLQMYKWESKMRTVQILRFQCCLNANSFRSFSRYFHALKNSNDTSSSSSSSFSITFTIYVDSKQSWLIACDRIKSFKLRNKLAIFLC